MNTKRSYAERLISDINSLRIKEYAVNITDIVAESEIEQAMFKFRSSLMHSFSLYYPWENYVSIYSPAIYKWDSRIYKPMLQPILGKDYFELQIVEKATRNYFTIFP